jgi:hypothetical protein
MCSSGPAVAGAEGNGQSPSQQRRVATWTSDRPYRCGPGCADLVRPTTQAEESIAAPKERGPRILRAFPLHATRFQRTAGRGHDRLLGPRATRLPCSEARAMPPLWQYFSRPLRQTSPSLPPKGTDPVPCGLFPLQTTRFQGTAGGAIIAILDPWQVDAGWWAKAVPALWQYFPRLAMSWPFSPKRRWVGPPPARAPAGGSARGRGGRPKPKMGCGAGPV